MTEVAAPVVAGLAKADEATRDKIQGEVLERAQQSMKDDKVRLRWPATTVSKARRTKKIAPIEGKGGGGINNKFLRPF